MRYEPCPICGDTLDYAGDTCTHSRREPTEPTGFTAALVFVLAIFTLGVIVGFLIGC